MNTSGRIAGCSVVTVALIAGSAAIYGQEGDANKKRPEGQKTAPAREHTAPPPREHTAPPQQHTAPPPQQAAPAQVQRTRPAPSEERRVQQPQQQPQRSPENVRPAPQDRRQGNTPVNQTPQQQPTTPQYRRNEGQPGRTFGTSPSPNGASAPYRRDTPPLNERRVSPSPGNVTTRNGDVIHRNSAGQVTQVRMNNGTTVYHPPNGPRRVEVVRPGGRVVVASAPGHGYVQRQVVVNNTTIIKRTYIYNGQPHARLYRPVVYGGVSLAIYTPVHYYRPAFYYYAYNPWARPVYYSWGWGGSPWYGYYGGYFTPYPVYASPSLWLTDYLIAATLESAYQERMAARAAAANAYNGGQQAPLTPEVKQAIADEVRRQIDYERAEGQSAGNSGDRPIFADNASHVFVVHDTLAVNSNAGECSISEGDVLQMNGAPPPNSSSADVVVLASRGPDCRKGSMVSVQLQDLQEMANQMRATIDRGMSDLQAKQGQSGLPSLPPNAAGTIDSAYAREAQPDANAIQDISGASREADQAEQQAVDQAPPTLSLGLTLDEVTAIQGRPDKIVDLGSKKTYIYKDVKVTFTDGKVTDIVVQ